MTALAQTADWMLPLANIGVAGVALVWLTTTVEKRLRAIEVAARGGEQANNRMTRAILLLVVSLRTANEAAKGEARGILREIDQAEGVTSREND